MDEWTIIVETGKVAKRKVTLNLYAKSSIFCYIELSVELKSEENRLGVDKIRFIW